MNKKFLIGLILVFGLSLSACGTKNAEVAKKSDNGQKEMEKLQKNSLVDWIKGGKTVECKIMTPEGEVTVKTKGNSSYMEGMPSFVPGSKPGAEMNHNGVILTIGDYTYMWDKITKKGTKMNTKEMNEMSDGMMQEEEAQDEDVATLAEEWDDSGYEYDCKEVKVSDSLFEEPKDVEFEDLNEKMRGFKEQSQKIQEQAANGGQIDPEELKKMMQGMQQ